MTHSNMYDYIKKKLEEMPKYRERKNKNRFTALATMKRFNLRPDETTVIATVSLIEDIQDYGRSFDRTWRQVLQENENLRGNDYEQKEQLEQEKQVELGYESSMFNDIMKKI